MKVTIDVKDEDGLYFLMDMIYDSWVTFGNNNEDESRDAAKDMYNQLGEYFEDEGFMPLE